MDFFLDSRYTKIIRESARWLETVSKSRSTYHIAKKAILVVSFGTSVNATREKTIDRIEADIQKSMPDRAFYRAWTSGMIIRKIEKRDGVHINTVEEAMEQMLSDGITDVIVQPTHVIRGIEYDQLKETVLEKGKEFEQVRIGTPLLTTSEDADADAVLQAVMAEIGAIGKEETVVFMGHGTPHDINSIYTELDQRLKELGYPQAFMGTVEAEPTLDTLLEKVKTLQVKRVILAPFMVVAGDHAMNDMAGDEDDSWKSTFEKAGYEVECILKGLGEYPAVRQIYVKHAMES